MKIIDWNINKTEEQFDSVNKLIEENINSAGEFMPDISKFANELSKIGYYWSGKENEICNVAKDDLFKKAHEIFKEEDILFLPHGGTLLGFLREKGSIAHDDDHDVSVDFNKLKEKFDVVNSKLISNGMKFGWNNGIIKNGLTEAWNPWTKIITDETFKIIIGSYSFKIFQTLDLFPIIRFDDFDGFIKILNTFFKAYGYSKKSNYAFVKNFHKVEKRKSILIDEYGQENYTKLLNFAKKYKKPFKPNSFLNKYYLRKMNNLMNKNGKYFTTLTFNILFKKWRETNEVFVEKYLENSQIKYFSSECDNKEIKMYYGENWENNPGIGPLHVLANWSFKGKIKTD